MKYNVLGSYKAFLEGSLRPETARTYYNRLDILLQGQSVLDITKSLDMEKILENLSKIKYKNHFSQSKNALLYFLKFQNIQLSDEHMKQIEQLEKNTRKKYRKLNAKNFEEIDKKIKHLRNKKLKLSYQTMLETGLRVSELAQITPLNSSISDDEICFSFTAKGGNKEEVKISKKENPRLFENLKETIEMAMENKKIFYSAIHLQREAKKLGFACHDLRRAFAKLEYKKTKSKDDVSSKLRHTNIKTTDIYLRSKLKI